MKNQHLCPCCSNPLLRHVSSKRTYWFCSQCYQEMPDIENVLETKLVAQHWLDKKITERHLPKVRVAVK
jgi:ribosomal protein L37AE/L43A